MDLKVKCKRCGGLAKPEEFVLDYEYKMMVCPSCVKERRKKKEVHDELQAQKQKVQKEQVQKPAGWDGEDEYIERMHRTKIMGTVKVEKVDEEKVRYKCPKCSYTFLYNIVKKTPVSCPYCSADIYKIRFE